MLEVIRYIFDLPLQTDKEYKESLIKNIFGSGGKATLSVFDKHGKHYIVSRIYGEQSNVRGSGISEIKYQYLCDTFRDYVELIEDWILCDGMKIKEIISSSEYTKLDKKLQDQYEDLLKNQVSNNVEIYYHDKLLRHHSIGQRASALILFILMQSDNDIILIDQPEDDLDNKIIYDEVITAIAKKKQDIQFIFATHNANIPVLGDAERIFVVEYQDTTIDISQGNIDLKSTHKQIVDIMEGGEEAFDKRQLIYTSWK